MTVQQLGENLSSNEITQWIAYFKIKKYEEDKEKKRAEAEAKSKQGKPQMPQTFGTME
jgi:hypothetical protein